MDQEDIGKSSIADSEQTSPTDKTGGGMTKAGEFNGDLRDLPKTVPPDQERLRRKDPPDEPLPAPTPKVKPLDL